MNNNELDILLQELSDIGALIQAAKDAAGTKRLILLARVEERMLSLSNLVTLSRLGK